MHNKDDAVDMFKQEQTAIQLYAASQVHARNLFVDLFSTFKTIRSTGRSIGLHKF